MDDSNDFIMKLFKKLNQWINGERWAMAMPAYERNQWANNSPSNQPTNGRPCVKAHQTNGPMEDHA